jgi:phosphotransferase family enzyme
MEDLAAKGYPLACPRSQGRGLNRWSGALPWDGALPASVHELASAGQYGREWIGMQASDIERAVGAAKEVASELGLPAADAMTLHNSNKLALRLLPCDVFARVAYAGFEQFETELEIGRKLAEVDAPVASLDRRVEPRAYERHGFAITFWTYYGQEPQQVPPADYANALERLHAGMAKVEAIVPHFSERVAEAQELVASPNRTPALEDSDRELLASTLRTQRSAITERSATEQLLHGEPHAGNMVNTKAGPLFIDLETCCRGPVEFDLAHVPEEVSEGYAGADQELLRTCRLLVLAMVAAWRWDQDDQYPNGKWAGHELLGALRAGPPWPTLDVVTPGSPLR